MKNYSLLKSIKNKLRAFTEYPLIEIENQVAKSPPKQSITPIVHQTWIDNKFGKTHTKSIKSFRSLNPNLSFKIYSNKEMKEYMKNNWSQHKIFNIFQIILKALLSMSRSLNDVSSRT